MQHSVTAIRPSLVRSGAVGSVPCRRDRLPSGRCLRSLRFPLGESTARATTSKHTPRHLSPTRAMIAHPGESDAPALSDREVRRAGDTDAHLEAFRRDGYVAIPNLITPSELALLREAADAEIARILDADPGRSGNRNVGTGGHRYSFGSIQQFPREEWAALADIIIPRIDSLLGEIFGSKDYQCVGAGGDFSLPGAKIQFLHSDLFGIPGFAEPQGAAQGTVTINHMPVPFVCVNVLLVDFTVRNGATRQIPGTQNSLDRIPPLDEEPEWMQHSQVCAPAGSVLVRDVRAWHGGCPNNLDSPPPADVIGKECLGPSSGYARPMLNVEFTAPWFRMKSREYGMLPRVWWDKLSPRTKDLTRGLLHDGLPEERSRDDLFGRDSLGPVANESAN